MIPTGESTKIRIIEVKGSVTEVLQKRGTQKTELTTTARKCVEKSKSRIFVPYNFSMIVTEISTFSVHLP